MTLSQSDAKVVREALKSFANAVFNDNGDVTIETSRINHGDYMRAKSVLAILDAQQTVCSTCNGRREIGGFENGAAPGYRTDPCPDCNAQEAVGATDDALYDLADRCGLLNKDGFRVVHRDDLVKAFRSLLSEQPAQPPVDFVMVPREFLEAVSVTPLHDHITTLDSLQEEAKALLASYVAPQPGAMKGAQIDTIICMLKWWLEWNEKEYAESKTPISDGTFIMRFPTHPTRGMFKAWIDVLASQQRAPSWDATELAEAILATIYMHDPEAKYGCDLVKAHSIAQSFATATREKVLEKAAKAIENMPPLFLEVRGSIAENPEVVAKQKDVRAAGIAVREQAAFAIRTLAKRGAD